MKTANGALISERTRIQVVQDRMYQGNRKRSEHIRKLNTDFTATGTFLNFFICVVGFSRPCCFFLQKWYKFKLLTKTAIYFFYGLHDRLLSSRKTASLAYLEPVSIWILMTGTSSVADPDPMPFWNLDPGWVKKIKIRIRDPDPKWISRIIFPRA